MSSLTIDGTISGNVSVNIPVINRPENYAGLSYVEQQYYKYLEEGYYSYNGYIYDTKLKEGDQVRIVARYYSNTQLQYNSVHTVEKIEQAGYSNDKLPAYYRRGKKGQYDYPAKPFNVLVKLIGVSNSIKAANVELISGANMNHLALPNPNAKNRSALVQEVEESVKDGKTVLTPIGNVLPFDSINDAQDHVKREIVASIRGNINYRKFKIFQEIAVAQAKEPEVSFV